MKDAAGKTPTPRTALTRNETAALKRAEVKKLAEAGLTKKQIQDKTGYPKSTIYFILNPDRRFIQASAKNKGRTAVLDNPNRQWRGRYCRKCKKKIIGGNHWYCNKCHFERLQNYHGEEFEATLGQNLMAL